MGHERDQDDWLGATLQQSAAAAPDACPDTETLAAWRDGGLDVKALAAVELHASTCSRCMAVLASMERTAPAAPARHAWMPARLFRWLAPLTAAVAAVVVWMVVPDRPISPAQESTPPQAASKSRPREQPELREEPAAPEARRASEAPAALAEAQSPPPPAALPAPPPPPAPTAPPAAARGSLAGTAATAQRSAFNELAPPPPMESVAPADPLMRWRVVMGMFVERSEDGGKTWVKTSPPPGVAPDSTPAVTVVSVRAIDASRAAVRTSDGAEAYTTDGGLSWTPVQENSAAPF